METNKDQTPEEENKLPVPTQEETNLPAVDTPEERAFKEQFRQGMQGFDFGAAFKHALGSLKKNGIAAFFENPQKVIEDAALGMHKDGKLPLNPNNNEPEKLTDGEN